MKFCFLFTFLLIVNVVFAQKVKILVTGEEKGKETPVPYANVCVESLDRHEKKYVLTNKDGIAELSIG